MMHLRYVVAVAFTLAAAVGVWASDEVTITAKLDVDNGDFDFVRQVSAHKVDQTTQSAAMGILSVGTGSNIVDCVNVATAGYGFLRNLGSDTNHIWVAVGGGTAGLVLLKDGDVALARFASTNIVAWTTNGTSNLEYWINAE